MNLVGLTGVFQGHNLVLGPETTIGREIGNTIVCQDDSSVSRRHARIVPLGPGFAIEDLGSSNGTFVNGARISGLVPLSPNDEIRIGAQAWRFEAPIQPSVQPPPVAGVIAPPRREVSRGEQGGVRQPPVNNLSGCAFPSFNLPDPEGCLRLLIMAVLACIAIGILAGALMLLGQGVASLGDRFGSHGGPPATSGSTGGASSGSGGSSGGSEEKNTKGIHIEEVHIASTWHASTKSNAPRALVTWDNQTDQPISRILGRVISMDAQGNELAREEKVVIFDGKPVPSGGKHTDSPLGNDGFDPPGARLPTSVRVEVTDFE